MGRERASLEAVVTTIEVLDAGCDDASDLLELAVEEDDEETAQSVEQDLVGLESELEKLEFRRMFSGETDPNNAYLDIQAGSGCLLYTSPSPRDRSLSRMPSSA